jgi:hypothetical protein
LCAAIVDRRDTTPAPPFSTAANSRVGQRKAGPNQVREMRELRRSPGEIVMHGQIQCE